MNDLYAWAREWGVPLAAVHDLQRRWGTLPAADDAPMAGKSESAVSAEARLRAREAGGLVLRNNSGAWSDPQTGRQTRYGLGNDSKAFADAFRSPDFVGCYPRLIAAEDVGTTIGQLWLIEAKEGDWQWTGNKHESAQLAFGQVFMRLGARFQFYTGGELL